MPKDVACLECRIENHRSGDFPLPPALSLRTDGVELNSEPGRRFPFVADAGQGPKCRTVVHRTDVSSTITLWLLCQLQRRPLTGDRESRACQGGCGGRRQDSGRGMVAACLHDPVLLIDELSGDPAFKDSTRLRNGLCLQSLGIFGMES